MKNNSFSSGRAPDNDDLDNAFQPFRLVEYFSFTTLTVILFASLALTWVISNNAKKVLLDRSEAYSLLFAENLNRQVFLQFVVPTYFHYGHIALSNEEQFKRLDEIVRNITKGMRIDSVKIYDSKENTISYSTERELTGRRGVGGLEYQKALRGENSSVLISSGSIFNLLPGTPPVYCKLKTFIPFKQDTEQGERDGNIMGVIEVVKDLSEDLKAIIELQTRIISLSLSIMIFLFGVLSFIVARGNRIIEARANERIRLKEQLNEAERLAGLGKMVAAVSHEIKNPLGIVRSTAEILGNRITKVAPGNEHLASIIIEETSRLDNIVREFLDFARPNTPRMQPASLNELVERAGRFMEPELQKKSVCMVQDLDQDLADLSMDAEQIYQVLLNIIINAVQAMPTGGTLTVKTGYPPDGRGALLMISDTGKGIPKDKQGQIFKPFYTDKHRGTGLGLAITKNIIEQHDGSISVTSEENKGSTFEVIIRGEE